MWSLAGGEAGIVGSRMIRGHSDDGRKSRCADLWTSTGTIGEQYERCFGVRGYFVRVNWK